MYQLTMQYARPNLTLPSKFIYSYSMIWNVILEFKTTNDHASENFEEIGGIQDVLRNSAFFKICVMAQKNDTDNNNLIMFY